MLDQDSTHPGYEAAFNIVKQLQGKGYTAYFAGGCVRDMLLKVTPKDYDVATNATPDEVKQIYPKARHVGEAFGVMLVYENQEPVEVATFRREWGYADGRHPDHIEFSDAESDAQRRDFTINGIFYDPVESKIYDFVGGESDLNAGVIKAIGNADERFSEDYLRMLRAVRFASRLGFEIESETQKAIKVHSSKLDQISRERIGMEVQMMFSHPSRQSSALLLQQFGLDAVVLKDDGLNDAVYDISGSLYSDVSYPCALAGWLIDRQLGMKRISLDSELIVDVLGNLKVNKIVRQARNALMLSNDHCDAISYLMKTLPMIYEWNNYDIAKKKRHIAHRYWDDLLRLFEAGTKQGEYAGMKWEQFELEIAELIKEGVNPPALLTGDGLIKAGYSPGPKFKLILDKVYDAQLRHEISTYEEAISLASTVE